MNFFQKNNKANITYFRLWRVEKPPCISAEVNDKLPIIKSAKFLEVFIVVRKCFSSFKWDLVEFVMTFTTIVVVRGRFSKFFLDYKKHQCAKLMIKWSQNTF